MSIIRTRTTALTSIDKLIVFTKDLDNKYPNIGFKNTLSEITRVREILSNATDRCLTDSQIDAFKRLGDMLTNNVIFGSKHFNSMKIQPKLLKFWTLCGNILYADNPHKIILWRLDPNLLKEDQVNALVEPLEKMNSVRGITSLIAAEVQNNPNSVLSITSILLTLIIRVETHEHELVKILNHMNKATGMNVNIEDLLSVESKVKKGNIFHTDVRAIRNATAHAKFKINKTNYQITFDNHDGGYNFTLTKTGQELLFFYQDYDRMLNLQFRLLSITLLIALLNNAIKVI